MNKFGRVVQAMARLVARCSRQHAGVDYLTNISPCPSVASIRSLDTIACELGWCYALFMPRKRFF